MTRLRFSFLLATLTLLLFALLAVNVTWGLPDYWHADEQLPAVITALSEGSLSVPETVFYPTLPFFAMVGTGKTIAFFGGDRLAVMAGIRLVSAALAGLVLVLTALTVVIAGRSHVAALLAAALLFTASGFVTIAHHAIVDTYLTFFVTLVMVLLLRHVATQRDIWLFLGFLAIGLAASSKYNGASLLLAATLFGPLFGAAHWRSGLLPVAGRLLAGYLLALLGFFLGTPRAILDAPAYLQALLPFLQRQRVYAGPRPVGLFGQWDRLLDGLGYALLLLFAAALLWSAWRVLRSLLAGTLLVSESPMHSTDKSSIGSNRFYLALLLLFVAFELPIAVSQFYPMRYMVPAYPLLAVLAALMIDDLYNSRWVQSSKRLGQAALVAVSAVVLLAGTLRVAGVVLSYANDSRTLASRSLPQLIEPGSRTEYTRYAPHLPTEDRVIAPYPLMAFKFEEDVTPHTGWNEGEAGIQQRRPDYLVVDRKTYRSFDDEHLCGLNMVECRFFQRLLEGQTDYELVETFAYRPPSFLPPVKTDFANIEILLFARRDEPRPPAPELPWLDAVDARFGEAIALQGSTVLPQANGRLAVTLYWSASARVAESYKVFVHCLDAQGELAAQSDSIPAGGAAPTFTWVRDEIVVDTHVIEPAEGGAGSCRLQVGLYAPESGERVPAFLAGDRAVGDAIKLPNSGD